MRDTNIAIAMIRHKPPRLLSHLTEHALGDLLISAISVAELHLGVAKSQQVLQNERALEQFLVPLGIAAFDERAAQTYGRLRAELERRGTPIGPLDTLIAAHALGWGAVLVTNNVSEFARARAAAGRLDDDGNVMRKGPRSVLCNG
jgi:tRNA(fMet)-specific endonuclease VapC